MITLIHINMLLVLFELTELQNHSSFNSSEYLIHKLRRPWLRTVWTATPVSLRFELDSTSSMTLASKIYPLHHNKSILQPRQRPQYYGQSNHNRQTQRRIVLSWSWSVWRSIVLAILMVVKHLIFHLIIGRRQAMIECSYWQTHSIMWYCNFERGV